MVSYCPRFQAFIGGLEIYFLWIRGHYSIWGWHVSTIRHCTTSQTLESDCIQPSSFPVPPQFSSHIFFLSNQLQTQLHKDMSLKGRCHDMVWSTNAQRLGNTGQNPHFDLRGVFSSLMVTKRKGLNPNNTSKVFFYCIILPYAKKPFGVSIL